MANTDDKSKSEKSLKPAAPTPGSNKIAPVDGTPDDKGSQKKSKKKEKETEDQRVATILARIKKRFERCVSSESENRKAMVEDAKFLAGEQWNASDVQERADDSRPCLTINKLKTFTHQITNGMREERPSINVSPIGEKSDVDTAKFYRGIIRHIERFSAAEIAYNTGFENVVGRGLGYWRIITEFEAPDTFNQCIRIERIRNIFTVYLDPGHQEPDGADAKYGFITDMIPRSEFESDYPDADPIPFEAAGQGDTLSLWSAKDEVRIAEYFEIEYEKRTLVLLSNGSEVWEDDLHDEIKKQIADGKIEIKRERESRVPTVKWYKVTAKEILKEQDWAGSSIPIIKCIGDEDDIEGKVKLSGVVRFAKDPQRMYNYWNTKLTEAVALAPNSPWVVEEGQIEGHETDWKSANRRPLPVLQYKGTTIGGTPAPPPQRQQFAGVPAGIVQALQTSAQDMMAVTGIRFDATSQDALYDESGRALREHRRTGDMGSFHYTDNFAISLKRTGECLIELIPKIYDTKRIVTILREDDTEETVMIDPDAGKATSERKNPENGKIQKIFNPKIGKYGVTVTIGPSYATKRVEAAESMMDFTRALPMVGEMISDLVAKNQDWPGASEMATRLAKAIAMKYPGIMSPDMKDVPPQVQAVLAQLQSQLQALNLEKQQMMKALTDQQAERAIETDKINKDFEAKLTKIAADLESKSAATQEKAVTNFNTHALAQIKTLGDTVMQLKDRLEKPAESAKETARSERITDSEKHHKEVVDKLDTIGDKFAEALTKSSQKTPRKFKIMRGKDGAMSELHEGE